MKKFIIKSIIFLTIIIGWITYTGTFLPPVAVPNSDDYMAILIDKHRIADSITTPKIILVGGSNLAFGIDSKMLRDQLGVPTANMGLHAGLGIDFMLKEAKSVAKKNDVIFLSIEYFLFAKGDYKLQKHTSRIFPKATEFYTKNTFLDTQDYLNDCQGIYKKVIDKQINSFTTTLAYLFPQEKKLTNNLPLAVVKPIVQVSKVNIYSRQATNKEADIVAHLEEYPRESLASDGIWTYQYWEGIKVINNFAEYAKENGIEVYFLFPNYPYKEFSENKNAVMLLEKDMRNNLNIEILNTPTQFVYPNAYFFDTHYHLNKIGREKRTQDMINIIKKNEKIMLLLEKMKKIN